MPDNIYEAFNDMSFEESEFEGVEASLTELEIKKLKKRLKGKYTNRMIKYIKAASICLVAALGITIATPAFAKTLGQYIPVLDSIYENLGYYNAYKDFSQYIGISKEDKGYKFTIDKLVADNDTVLIALRVNKQDMNVGSKDKNQDNKFMMTSYLSGNMGGTISSGCVDKRILDKDTTLVLIESYTNPEKTLSKRFNIHVNIHSTDDENINVNFDLPVSTEKIKKETLVKKKIGDSSFGDMGKIKLHDLKASPISTTINYSPYGDLYGNNLVNFYIYDEKGNIYFDASGGADGSGYVKATFNRLDKAAEKLFIVPYIPVYKTLNAEEVAKFDFYNKYFNLDNVRAFDFKEDGRVEVYKIEKGSDNIKIYYKLSGKESMLARGYTLIQLYESKGGSPKDKVWIPIRQMKIYRPDLKEEDNYVIEFTNLDINKQYTYSVNPNPYEKIIEGKPVEIDLK